MPAAHLPILCGRCSRVYLQPVEAGQVPSCRTCGAASAVLPGATYEESDVELFDRIEASVRSLQVSRNVAQRAVRELRDVALRTEAPESVLLRVIDLMPTLQFLIPALHRGRTPPPPRQRLAVATGMLTIIVDARLRELEASPTG
jgi:hypothetical protein